MSMLGILAGFGDAARKDNEQRAKDSAKRRDMFADDLRRIMESGDWPDDARTKAAQLRFQLYSNPKIKDRDYEKMWKELHSSSRRPGTPSAETAAARSEIPALQSLRQNMEPSAGVPEAPQDGLTMRPQNGASGLSLLRPYGEAQAEQTDPMLGGGAASRFNLQAPQQADNLLAPRSTADATDQRISAAQTHVAANPTQDVYGPYTRAERSQHAADDMRTQMQMQVDMVRQMAGETNGDNDLIPLLGHYRGQPTLRTVVNRRTHEPATFIDADGQQKTGLIRTDVYGRAVDAADGRPVQGVIRRETANRPMAISTMNELGQKITEFQNSLDMVQQPGKQYGQYVRPTITVQPTVDGTLVAHAMTPDGQIIRSTPIGRRPHSDDEMVSQELNNLIKQQRLLTGWMTGGNIVQNVGPEGGQDYFLPRVAVAEQMGFTPGTELGMPPIPSRTRMKGINDFTGEERKAFQNVRAGLGMLDHVMDTVDTLEEKFGGTPGGWKGRYQMFKQSMTRVTPEERELFNALEQYFNNYRVAITGAQAGMQEIMMLREVTPDLRKPNWMEDLTFNYRLMARRYQMATGMPYVPTGQLPSMDEIRANTEYLTNWRAQQDREKALRRPLPPPSVVAPDAPQSKPPVQPGAGSPGAVSQFMQKLLEGLD
jgi:hypothetical protein